jgi:hypothetical protein
VVISITWVFVEKKKDKTTRTGSLSTFLVSPAQTSVKNLRGALWGLAL